MPNSAPQTHSQPDAPDPSRASAPQAPSIDGVALQKKARFGTIALASRMVAMQFVVLGGDVYLKRLLEPADFGLFAIVQFALTFFVQLGDAGLGGALIQKSDEPTQRELSSIWYLQIGLALAIVFIVGVSAPYIILLWPDMRSNGVWLLRALSLNLLFTAVRAVPTLLMERHLHYGRLSFLEVILNITFYAAAVILAGRGYGVMALVGAVLVQGIFGVVGAFAMRPWAPSLVFDIAALRPVLRFGAAYQVKNIIGFATSAITPLYAGRTLGQTALGFIGWAQSTAFFPLRLVEVMGRVTFPLFSRLQGDRLLLAKSLERSVQICAMGTLFFVGLAFGIGPNIVRVIYTEKWMPALPLLYVYAAGISFGFLAPLLAPALDAIGRPQVIARLSIGWTAATYLLVLFTTPRWGALGFTIGYCIPMVIGNLVVIAVLKRLIPGAKLWPRARAAIAGGLVVALLGRFALRAFATTPMSFLFAVVVEVAAFAGTVFILDRSTVTDALSILPRKRK